jgi:hypothetical protein
VDLCRWVHKSAIVVSGSSAMDMVLSAMVDIDRETLAQGALAASSDLCLPVSGCSLLLKILD